MSQNVNTKEWDSHLKSTLELWRAPGLAAVALKDNEVVYSKGFGYRDIESKFEMTKDTIHPIASCTKSFTSTAIAMLVDEGKLEWSTPVQEFHLDPSADIRMTYQYCNLMYLAASVIIEELSGMSYNDFIAKRIFRPLGMKDSNFSVTDMQETPNHAKPYKIDYRKEEFDIVRCDFVVNDAASGAGCINASIDDMGKWLAFHLNSGKAGNKQLVSPENLRMTHDPVIIDSAHGFLSTYIPDQKWFRMNTFALGWGGVIYRGLRLMYHPGGITGSSSLMTFLPDENAGVMAVVNQKNSHLPFATLFHLLDSILGLDLVDWNDIMKSIEDSETKATKETGETSQELRKTDTQPSHNLQEYAGIYHHPGYGRFSVRAENGGLKTTYGTTDVPLTHYHYDTFQLEIDRLDLKELLTFQTDSNGDVFAFAVKTEETLPPVLFKRLPDEHLRDKKFLKTLVGKYDVAGQIIEIILKGKDAITAVPSGQPAVDLEPIRGMRFKTKDSDRFSITFRKDESGKVSEFLYSELGLVIPAKRIS